MDLNQFEKRNSSQEQIIHGQALGESEASFARTEMEEMKHKIELKKKRQKKSRIVFGGIVGVMVLLFIFATYSQYRLYTLTQDEKNTIGTPLVITASTTPEEIVSALGKHILLPSGNPQIAEVKDIEKLRDQQAFFKNAENGDLIVLYETTIFIYRPSSDIVIATGDISGVGQAKP